MTSRCTERRVLVAAIALVAAAGLGLAAVRTPVARRQARDLRLFARRKARYAAGRMRGVAYRLWSRGPSPEVPDAVVAQRVRSKLGPLRKRLDLPQIHVSVCGHEVDLHGAVDTPGQARRIAAAAANIPGVDVVTSHLRVGLAAGATRPSQGRVRPPSTARRTLLLAASEAGAEAATSEQLTAAILDAFLYRLPAGERAHVLAHLPADVRTLLAPSPPAGVDRIRRVGDLVGAVASRTGVDPDQADTATRAVLVALHELVPEETDDVAQVLPSALRGIWAASATPGSPTTGAPSR